MNDPAHRDLEEGESAHAAEQFAPLLYDELRSLARAYLRPRGPDAVLQTTALVHEAYVRLLGARDMRWEGRAHFFAVAARAMRQVLASHARALNTTKRGGNRRRVTLSEAFIPAQTDQIDLADLDQALSRLAELDERQLRIVEQRFFAGMRMEEIAYVEGVSVSTVEREWRAARAWLSAELRRSADP